MDCFFLEFSTTPRLWLTTVTAAMESEASGKKSLFSSCLFLLVYLSVLQVLCHLSVLKRFILPFYFLAFNAVTLASKLALKHLNWTKFISVFSTSRISAVTGLLFNLYISIFYFRSNLTLPCVYKTFDLFIVYNLSITLFYHLPAALSSFFVMGPSLAWSSLVRWGWLTSEPQDLPVSTSPYWENKHTLPCLAFLCGFGGVTLRTSHLQAPHTPAIFLCVVLCLF